MQHHKQIYRWADLDSSLQTCYQYWGDNIRATNEPHTLANFGSWLCLVYGITICYVQNDFMVEIPKIEDKIRFLIEWG